MSSPPSPSEKETGWYPGKLFGRKREESGSSSSGGGGKRDDTPSSLGGSQSQHTASSQPSTSTSTSSVSASAPTTSLDSSEERDKGWYLGKKLDDMKKAKKEKMSKDMASRDAQVDDSDLLSNASNDSKDRKNSTDETSSSNFGSNSERASGGSGGSGESHKPKIPAAVNPAAILGTVTVTFREFRYLTFVKNPSAAVSVEYRTEVIHKIPENAPIYPANVMKFNFREITSDIIIFFYEDLQQKLDRKEPPEPCGRIIIPFSHFFGSTKVNAPEFEWRMIHPMQYHTKEKINMQRYHMRYRSGLEEISDSGMNRPKVSLGLVNFKVEFQLNGPLLRLYLSDGLVRYNTNQRKSIEASTEKNQNYKVAIAKVYRDTRRILKLVSAPALISQFLTFPEIFILIGVLYCLCGSVRSFSVPLMLVILTYLNGLVSNSFRTYSNLIVWNNPVIMTRINNVRGGSKVNEVFDEGALDNITLMNPNSRKNELSIKALQPAFQEFLINQAENAAYWASTLEKWINLWSFGDARLSNLLFAVLLALSIASAVGILIFGWFRYFFSVGSLILLYLTFYDQVTETLNAIILTPASKESSTSSSASTNKWSPGKIVKVNDNGTYDITYSDGETVTKVPHSFIRAIEAFVSSSSSSNSSNNKSADNADASAADGKKSAKFTENDKIECKYRIKTKAEKVRDIFVIVFEKFCRIIRAIENVWLRVPDELELEHRYISSLSLVKAYGAEMIEAEENWNKMKTGGGN